MPSEVQILTKKITNAMILGTTRIEVNMSNTRKLSPRTQSELQEVAKLKGVTLIFSAHKNVGFSL